MYDQERLLIVPAYLNTLLPLTRRHVEMGNYGQKRVLIVLGISQYFFLWSGLVEIEKNDQERLLIVPGTS